MHGTRTGEIDRSSEEECDGIWKTLTILREQENYKDEVSDQMNERRNVIKHTLTAASAGQCGDETWVAESLESPSSLGFSSNSMMLLCYLFR
jgi:hypothetical protein